MRHFSPIVCHVCHLDRQANTFRRVHILKYPKFTIHHSTTSHTCLITDGESVRVEFSSINLFDVERISGHNVVLLRVKRLRTHYIIDINRYYIVFGSDQHANTFYETILKLVHSVRPETSFTPIMSSETHSIQDTLIHSDDEIVAVDPSHSRYPLQLNDSIAADLAPVEPLQREPSVAPVRRGPVRVLRAPPGLCQRITRAAKKAEDLHNDHDMSFE